jgi:hypothetical protein
MKRILWGSVFLSVLGRFAVESLQAGTPRCLALTPAGCQRGAEITLSGRGSNLDDFQTIQFDEPGFDVEVLKAEKGRFEAKVKVGAQVRTGEHHCRVVTASGVADVRAFLVTPFPMVAELEDKAVPGKVQPLVLGTTVYGQVQNEDVDRFEVELKKGQRLSVEVFASKLQTQQINDTLLQITKADGSQVIEVDDGSFSQQDPIVSVVVPEDGKYVVSLKESTNAGLGESPYLMSIGTFPRPVVAYPLGGQAGQELPLRLIGDASGVIEKTVKLPEQERDAFEVYTEDAQLAPQPTLVRVSAFPNVLEEEPNQDIVKAPATALSPPFALNGVLSEKGDVDAFKFTAKKGQEFDLNVYARKLRSPVDTVIAVHDAKGARLGLNDDGGHPDSYLRWKAPADGEFVVTVQDQLQRGGPDYAYRVEVTAPQAKVGLWLPEMILNNNQERRAVVVPRGNRYATLVRAKRTDFAGDVTVSAEGLPQGVAAMGMVMDKSVDTVPMVFEAASDAAVGPSFFGLGGQWKDAPAGASLKSEVDHLVDVIENGNQKPFYTVRHRALPLTVAKEIPLKLSLEQPKVPLLQTGSMGLKVRLERSGDFKGPVSLNLLYLPPGIGSAGTMQVKEGENEAIYTISANGNAPLRNWLLCIVGTADFGSGPVWMSTGMIQVQVEDPFIAGQITRSFVDQGDSTSLRVKLDSKRPFEGAAKISLLGLPPNATAEDRQITKDDKEVEFIVKAGPNTPAATHKQLFCQFQLAKDGEQMTSSFGNGGILRVDKATLAKTEAPKQ